MSISDKDLAIWLEKYNLLETASDKQWGKMEKYEVAGDDFRARRAADRMNEIDAQRRGMLQALEIFGYTTVYQDGICKIVTYS